MIKNNSCNKHVLNGTTLSSHVSFYYHFIIYCYKCYYFYLSSMFMIYEKMSIFGDKINHLYFMKIEWHIKLLWLKVISMGSFVFFIRIVASIPLGKLALVPSLFRVEFRSLSISLCKDMTKNATYTMYILITNCLY